MTQGAVQLNGVLVAVAVGVLVAMTLSEDPIRVMLLAPVVALGGAKGWS